MSVIRFLPLCLLAPLWACATTGVGPHPGCPELSNIDYVFNVHDPKDSPDTTSREIAAPQQHQQAFDEAGVHFGSAFHGGRMGEWRREEGHFAMTIAPENAPPINDSPWYAFTVTADEKQRVELALHYEGGTHRYHPKLSRDGQRFEPIAEADYRVDDEANVAYLSVDVGPLPVWVSAQELVLPSSIRGWAEQLAARGAALDIVGRSMKDRPLMRLTLGRRSDAPALLIVSRQHPPEVTGQLAMMAFVEALAEDEDLARRFRERFRIDVYPMLNPDGVVNGHWRHNAGGVDLNRDWLAFVQPESKIVSQDVLSRESERVVFGLDFHSTYKDVFYVRDNDGSFPAHDARWICGVAQTLPERRFRVQPVTSRVSAASVWMGRELKIPAVTYEVGDETPRDELRRVARDSARVLMTQLLEVTE